MTELTDTLSKDAKNMGLLVHAASFVGYIFPLGSVLGPLIIWLMKRDEFEFVNQCGKNCINFKLSLMIYALVSGILIFIGVGVLLLAALALLDIVCTIIAMVKASDGKAYQYPLTIRFLK
ncbi:DUF4870 domain-containing protein [Shewanella sp. SR43-4]|jgi:uncharacterized Tic20 family protein|uniref:DUF4870 domain-containing protein n=1 Tax=Shewanella TaxID=22 RepID=UPI000C41356C|nr:MULTISPECIES: DUF4870 domain-containing protein [Shewanella]NCQ46517.1 DUF4870 domain-containing protein [Shewanella frigidimarina]MBB1319317.1 DUF4870 domain-containing protein [Shewanella sp. SR43-4]MBB1323611.1 DUF4870 domain-containing protein [Shewanella sp. SR43-8]MBB1390859.1 DUF4870 domain-containing protein [Shewanella sp. SG44-6]NCO72749.1 DUF4870 domain-containing protein [Shewanella vesiculosa]|tara:strand:+ start:7167 stop:7526 length:360 start_codon:yes stop_codon:yes gene_type:complete